MIENMEVGQGRIDWKHWSMSGNVWLKTWKYPREGMIENMEVCQGMYD